MLRHAVPAIVCFACSCSLALEGRYTAPEDPDAGRPSMPFEVEASVPADAADESALTADAADADADAPYSTPPFTCPNGAQHEHEPNDSSDHPDTMKPGVFCGEVSLTDTDVVRLNVAPNSQFDVRVEAAFDVYSVLLDGLSTATANGIALFRGDANDPPALLQLSAGGIGPYPYRVTLTQK